MAVKYFCDRCGSEIKSPGLKIPPPISSIWGYNEKREKLICESCFKRILYVFDNYEHNSI